MFIKSFFINILWTHIQKIEANRIKYIRDHQKELRTELYKGLLDFVTDNLKDVIGRLTVLININKHFIIF
jgi:hypothetical protein